MLQKIVNNNVYYLTKSIKVLKEKNGKESYVTIPKGYAVRITKGVFYKDTYQLESVELKVSTTYSEKTLLGMLEEGIETLHDGEIFLMRFNSGNKNYEVVGYDFDKMAKSILKLYNKYCWDEKHTLKELSTNEDFSFRVFKVKLEDAFDDDEERSLTEYVGDYLNKWRPTEKSYWIPSYQKWNN